VRRAVLVLLAVALGAGCTEGRPTAERRSGATLRCDAQPGRGVTGFVLEGTREFDEGDRIAVRKDYRDDEGRLLVYLLGLSGEIGEGLPVLGEVRLASGERASFLGEGEAWMLVWESGFPCPQMGVVGNRMGKEAFLRLMVHAAILPPDEASELLGTTLTEWVAVFHTARTVSALDQDTDALSEFAPNNLIVGPVGCHEGLAEELGVGEGTYFSGIVAETESELEAAVEDARRSPRFEEERVRFRGELQLLCAAD
jgi:hypothetical protein